MSNPYFDLAQAVRQLVGIADSRPGVSLGHVIEHELPNLRELLQAAETARRQTVPDLYQSRVVWDSGNGDWLNVSPDEASVLRKSPYLAHHQVRELFAHPYVAGKNAA